MNGRVYDPQLGRFLTADPTVQYPESTQNYNRYSYVDNNPLSFTDPSGFGFFSDIARGIRGIFRAIRQNFRSILAIGVAFIPGINVIAAGFISGLISGGDLKSGIIGALTAGAFKFVHGLPLTDAGRVLAHGIVGGAASVAQGGKFGSGFLSGAFGQLSSQNISGNWGRIGSTVAAAVSGGIGAVLGGGKFANGAITGAFGRLFNDLVEYQGEPDLPLGDVYPEALLPVGRLIDGIIYGARALFGLGATKGLVVIGETMVRVEQAAAKLPGAKILNDMPDFSSMNMNPNQVTSAMMQYNRKWILEQMRSGRQIIDIGADVNRATPSIFYRMEQNMMKNYQKIHPEFSGAVRR